MLQISDTEIFGNSAVDVATLKRSLLKDGVFNLAGPALRQMVGKGLTDHGIEFVANCGYGGGGGVCFVLNQMSKRAPAKVTMINAVIKDNTAVNGGKWENYRVFGTLISL